MVREDRSCSGGCWGLKMEIVMGEEATHWLGIPTLECYLEEKEIFIKCLEI